MIKGKIFDLLAATALLSGAGATVPDTENRITPIPGKILPAKVWAKKKKRRKMQGDSRKVNR